jgi:phage terminase large subunit-like protein
MKSLIVSVFLLPWIWLKRPSYRSINISNSKDLALTFSVKTRDLMCDDWYQSFPETGRWQLRVDQNNKTHFENTLGGFRLATSTGTSITGYRGDGIFVDDGNDAAKTSDAALAEVNSSWDRGQANRLRSYTTGIRVCIQQRVHENDLTGHLLEIQPGKWEQIVIRSEYELNDKHKRALDPRTEPDQLLSPILQPQEYIDDAKQELDDYGFAGLHQQRPSPRTGGMFEVDKIKIVDVAPADLKWLRAWDPAYTDKKTSCDSAGAKMAMHEGITYIEDITYKKTNNPDDYVVATAELDSTGTKILYPQDPGAGIKVFADLSKRLQGYTLKSHRPSEDKVAAWLPMASQINAGNFRLVRGEWNKAFIGDLQSAPLVKRKDLIDAASYGYQELALKRKPHFG